MLWSVRLFVCLSHARIYDMMTMMMVDDDDD